MNDSLERLKKGYKSGIGFLKFLNSSRMLILGSLIYLVTFVPFSYILDRSLNTFDTCLCLSLYLELLIVCSYYLNLHIERYIADKYNINIKKEYIVEDDNTLFKYLDYNENISVTNIDKGKKEKLDLNTDLTSSNIEENLDFCKDDTLRVKM